MPRNSFLRVGGFISAFAICVAFSAQAELSLFGGSGHEEYLGCFDCSKHSAESICNRHGSYGSRHSAESIWNRHGTFGSRHSADSPWNRHATSNSVPVLVDEEGNFFGYLTINKYRNDAVDFADDLADFYDQVDGDLQEVRDALCEK